MVRSPYFLDRALSLALLGDAPSQVDGNEVNKVDFWHRVGSID